MRRVPDWTSIKNLPANLWNFDQTKLLVAACHPTTCVSMMMILNQYSTPIETKSNCEERLPPRNSVAVSDSVELDLGRVERAIGHTMQGLVFDPRHGRDIERWLHNTRWLVLVDSTSRHASRNSPTGQCVGRCRWIGESKLVAPKGLSVVLGVSLLVFRLSRKKQSSRMSRGT